MAAPDPPAIPRPASPPPGFVVARWTYVDEARTHEVRAGVRPGPKPAFVIKESAYQNEQADEAVLQELPIEAPWEAQLHHWQLECRLSILGKYWRSDASEPGWRPLVPPQGRPELDLREVGPNPYRGRVVAYHFHASDKSRDHALLAIPSGGPAGKRHLLARATFTFPNGGDADITLLHAHLPEAPARSLIVREHMLLRERTQKLVGPTHFKAAHGDAWERELASAYEGILGRISDSRFGPAHKERSQVIDPLYTDFVKALTDPRFLDLQARFLSPEEQEEALAGGESGIRRMIAEKRAGVRHEDQHKLTLVEASLLARLQLRPGQHVDPEVSALVRRFAYYL